MLTALRASILAGADPRFSTFGKFNSRLAEILHDLCGISAQDEELGESESFGWYALFRPERCIVSEDSQGFVYAEYFETSEALDKAWNKLSNDWEECQGPREDDWTIADAAGGKYVAQIVGSPRSKLVCNTREECEEYIKACMRDDSYWPNVWWISDHGNSHRITIA